MLNNDSIFLLSSLSEGEFIDTSSVIEWIHSKNKEIKTNIEQVPLKRLNNWVYTDQSIRNFNGKFFSIEGIHVNTNWGITNEWSQPIINQPEIGILGMITKKIDGILHFLIQAKIEPGNINVVQISPTLQATRSNYTCAHKGKKPQYLEYFTGEKPVVVLIDLLQSEQGARFKRKRNRNIIIELDATTDIAIDDNYTWVSLGQLKHLVKQDNLVNMDTRTVMSCINLGTYSEETVDLLYKFNYKAFKNNQLNASYIYSLLTSEKQIHSAQYIHNWLTNLKFGADLTVLNTDLSKLTSWEYDGVELAHTQKKYFSVIGVNVEIENREVQKWDQPMIKPAQEGLIAFIVKKINGIYHFLVQAKLEPGNFDILELAPTVQCLTGSYRDGENEYYVPYIKEVLDAKPNQVWYAAYQSEEGGRFYHEQNVNMIVEAGMDFNETVSPKYCWMTLNQLISFVSYSNYVNIAARSLLSAISILK